MQSCKMRQEFGDLAEIALDKTHLELDRRMVIWSRAWPSQLKSRPAHAGVIDGPLSPLLRHKQERLHER